MHASLGGKSPIEYELHQAAWTKAASTNRQQLAHNPSRPDPRELEAEITALRRRVRELEKENEFLGKASAFFASVHQNTSALN